MIMAATVKPKQTCPASLSTPTPFNPLKYMVIPLKNTVVKIFISPDTIRIMINGNTFDTTFGAGIELQITPSEIQFNPQENTTGQQVSEIPRKQSFGMDNRSPPADKIGKSQQEKIFNTEPHHEISKVQQDFFNQILWES